MPSKDREIEGEEKLGERRHRPKSERDPNRPHKSRSSRPKIIDPETGEVIKHRRRKDKDREKDKSSTPSSSMADLVPEIARTASAPGATSRSSLPYPSFNKAFSKEAVNSRDDVRLKKSPYTPESTDVGSGETRRSASADFTRSANKDYRPPSPPETEFSQQQKGTPSRMAQVQEDVEIESRTSSRSSFRRSNDRDDRSKLSIKSKVSEASKASTAKASPRSPRKATVEEVIEVVLAGSGDSNVTSVAPTQDKPRPTVIETDSSPASAQDSSPRTPTQTPTFPPVEPKPAPSYVQFEPSEAPSSVYDSPMPPPPPPPPMAPINIPQVDYLMQNGGLLRPVSKTILSVTPNFSPNPNLPHRSTPMPSEIEKIFGPYFNVLDQYEAVINKNGSLAVATGYRSVARRLLDRLENVFNRDLSSEGCACVMCQNPDLTTHEGSRGLGWGEVLEWVSARRELPTWPAFDFATLGVKAGEEMAGLGISGHHRNGSEGFRPSSPIKMDPDIAEEFRDHFLAQSAKKKIAVNKWLSSCPQTAAAPPSEVDDETLSFAILTHLDQQDRPVFNALINGSIVLQPVSRAPTTVRKPRSEFMIRTVHSIQRLYRLQTPPRDPEAAVYLLKNPNIHNLLATMSSINASEWEILTSGRFDGFLWSGAEESMNNSPVVSRGPTPVNQEFRMSTMSPVFRQAQANASRTTTPFSPMRNQAFTPMDGIRSSTFSPSFGFPPSRGPTPMRHPVSNDEETEIQVLAEVEREIYLGMEALEDAFEGLHRKAEVVRQALRQRGAGLSMSLQSRRTSQPGIIRSNTPGWGGSQWGGVRYERDRYESSETNSESEWDADDGQSEIAPDDSASNISSSRIRRPKRRNERRTPAPVEEEEDEGN